MATETDTRYDPADGPRDRGLRVGTRERDAVGAILRRHHLEGRLDADEFEARLDRCLHATTYADLDVLLVDLPREGRERRAPRQWSRRRRPFPLLCLLPFVLVAAIAGVHVAWLVVPALFFLFVLRPVLRSL